MTHSTSRIDSVFSEILGVMPIRIYQKTLGQVLPDSCRFYPTCSQYGVIAVRRFGLRKGLDLTARRIRRCHRPNGGYDPVPQVYAHSNHTPRHALSRQDATPIGGSVKGSYSTTYRLILATQLESHSFTREDLASHIEDFKRGVVNNQYTILYDLSLFEVGCVRFSRS